MFIIIAKLLLLIALISALVFGFANAKVRKPIYNHLHLYRWQLLMTTAIVATILIISQIGT